MPMPKHLTLALAACLTLPALAYGQDEEQITPPILFTNATVFDGFNPELIEGANVLVEGNVITQVSTDPIEVEGAFEVDVTGKYMTPGLIDMHTHIVFMTPEGTNTFQDEWDFGGAGAMAAQAIRDDFLMKGITTVRDIAGNSRGIARASQRGILVAPRILHLRRGAQPYGRPR